MIATFAFAVCAGAYIISNAPTKVPLAAALPFKASEAALNPLILDTAAVAASTASSTDIAADSSGSMLSAKTSASLSPSSSGVANAAPAISSVKQLEALGISTFLGNNTGAIASWYRTENPGDHTNGERCVVFVYEMIALLTRFWLKQGDLGVNFHVRRSWCPPAGGHERLLTELRGIDNNSMPGFAPSLKTMLASFDQNATAAKIAFCGLEARVYSPVTQNMTKLYIADAFDDTWVLTPASIDVIKGSVSPFSFCVRCSASSGRGAHLAASVPEPLWQHDGRQERRRPGCLVVLDRGPQRDVRVSCFRI